ncbi:MAG: DUF87 domain-containing protein [Chloroflexota bacterium]|nr:DUF87 domain-containing protein [Chloroflexota bacterium]
MIDRLRGLVRGARRPSRSLLPVLAISGDALHLAGGTLRAVMECPTLAFGIKGEADQRAVIDGWTALLNSLSHPIEVVIRSRELDPRELAPLPTRAGDTDRTALRDSYRRLVGELAEQRRVLERRFFVVVPHDEVLGRRKDPGNAALEALEQRVRWIETSLRRLDLQPRRLGDRELAELLRRTVDPDAAAQPLSLDDALFDVGSLISPAAFMERPGAVSVGERLGRTIAVTRYPARLHPGWLGDLQGFAGDLDVALHVTPNAGAAVMSFLERRVAELSSTVRVTEQQGGRADPYRRAALQDALELQDRIAQGSERLFDASLLLTLWARSLDDLDAQTRRMEALLGARMVHTRRLLFQMRGGFVTTLPLGLEAVSVRRVLSTTALSASFPFTGSDLPTGAGLLYGINTATRSPVVLDRFALENHNAVVFATSGAGKSFLVKVELARAILAGTRALVIDPEGEYAPLVAEVGGRIETVRPGAGGLDPFALAEGAPGSLSARIAVLMTLVDLLTGGLGPAQRAAVSEAISAAYAHAGFADGEPTAGLAPPRLVDVQQRLRSRREGEGVGLRLERYVSGAGRWLFQPPDASTAPTGPSVAYVLAGLPEEERAAAMFLVLDRIWAGLSAALHPTLVVVDEAWWLMRHADTAAFLFRLVKTARKRRAGLTLVTQDVGDLLSSPDGEAVVANAALQILMKQAPQAMPRLAELFRLTRAEQSWLLGAQRGEGLLVAQGRRVPFQVVATDEERRLIELRASGDHATADVA